MIATGGGPVPDPHTTGAVGGQGLHTTGEGGQGPVPVPHVGGIATIDVVPVPGRGHRTREGGRETERGGDRGIERGRGIGTVAEIDVGHQGEGQRRPAPTALLPKNQSKKIKTTVNSKYLACKIFRVKIFVLNNFRTNDHILHYC